VNNPDYPAIAEDYAATFKKLKTLPYNIFLAPHADQFALTEKLDRLARNADSNPFADADGWRRLITNAESNFLKQLAGEEAAR
jgi:hypothetical protein